MELALPIQHIIDESSRILEDLLLGMLMGETARGLVDVSGCRW